MASLRDDARLYNKTPAAPDTTRQRDRRREKQQLSCNFCRGRKIRCDRELPCKACIDKDIGSSCTYAAGPHRRAATTVGDRIKELEILVRSLMHQHLQSASSESASSAAHTPSSHENISQHTFGSTYADREKGDNLAEHKNLRLHSHGCNYVSSVHWAAILDSISELNNSYETEQEVAMLASGPDKSHFDQGPRLLYAPIQATKVEILSSIPARAVVDRMVARYFNTQGIAPAVLSSVEFLREYEHFWLNPSAMTFGWIGLLFSIMCLSTQYQQFTEDPIDSDTSTRVLMFRDRTVQCLVLSNFTMGGPYVLETLIIHVNSEVLMYKDAEIGLWLVLGMVVQLAISLGYHRDPRHFPQISAFAGEMRRRVWAAIVQMDLRLSSQMGLPRILKSQQSDTSEPRNLLDSDFDASSTELPLSRPETEVTPVLYGLAKMKIDRIGYLIMDLVSDTHEHELEEIMILDNKLHAAESSLPLIFQWRPLSQSLMVSPQIVLHRLLLRMSIQRLTISLHRPYLSTRYATESRYGHCRDACVRAAIEILNLQQLVHEEIQPDGLLYSVRWLLSSLMRSVFLLGMSILCYYVQLIRSTQSAPPDFDKVVNLLNKIYPIWLRLSGVSQDAQKAVEHLNLVLELPHTQLNSQVANEVEVISSSDHKDQSQWDAYHDIASFSIDTDLMAWDTPKHSLIGDMSPTQWLPESQLS